MPSIKNMVDDRIERERDALLAMLKEVKQTASTSHWLAASKLIRAIENHSKLPEGEEEEDSNVA